MIPIDVLCGWCMRNFLKWAWTFIADATQAWQLWAWLAPTGLATAMTGYFAELADCPRYLVILYALAAFCFASVGAAGVFHALLRQNEWHHRTTVDGKLEYLAPFFAVDVHWSTDGVAEFIDKINIGLTLANRSLYTIYYNVVYFHALVESRGPNTDKYVGVTFPVVSDATNRSNPEPVYVGDLRKLEVQGTIEFELAYGRKDDMKYKIKRKQTFNVVVHPGASIKPNPNVAVAVLDKE